MGPRDDVEPQLGTLGSELGLVAAGAQPPASRPAGRMIYSSGSTHLLSAFLKRATGMRALELGRRYLEWSLGILLPAWTHDPTGVYLGGNVMAPTRRAILAVANLFRRGGTSDG